jgi:Immunoglobulin I-set domain.
MPRVQLHPKYQDVRVGDRVEFRCDASGVPTPSLEWIKNQRDPLNPEVSRNRAGFLKATLHFANF